jgi:hypothetical protein
VTEKKKPSDEMRMSAREFDRIMGKALRVKRAEAEGKKRPKAKAKKPHSR